MFRKKALEAQAQPDSFDQLLVVVSPRPTLVLFTLCAAIMGALIWSFTSKLPVTVGGDGVLIKPNSIRTLQSTGSGVVTSVGVQVGSLVRAGDIVGNLDKPDLSRKLEQSVSKYLSLQKFNLGAKRISRDKLQAKLEQIEANIDDANRNLKAIGVLRANQKNRSTNATRNRLESLKKKRRMMAELLESQKQQLKNLEELVEEGLAARSQLLTQQSTVNQTTSSLAGMDVELQTVRGGKVDAEKQDLRLVQEQEQLRNKLKQYRIDRKQALLNLEQELHQKSLQESELEATIRLSRETLFRETVVRSPYSGRVLEVGLSTGTMINNGDRSAVLQLDPQEPFKQLRVMEDASYGDISLIVNGVQGSPLKLPLSKEKIETEVRKYLDVPDQVAVHEIKAGYVYDFRYRPGTMFSLDVQDDALYARNQIPTIAVVSDFGDTIEDEDMKHLAFFKVGKGKNIQPGMKIRISPSNIERARFGSINGVVTSVSSFPVSSESILNLVGNQDLATKLTQKGGTILVEATLNKDPDSPNGYEWTSAPNDKPVTAGTTTKCKVTVEERAPITYVIPLLRKWLLGMGDQAPAKAG